MPKQLFVAFTGEGSTDKIFLGIIISRVLENIALQNNLAFQVMEIIWLGGSKGYRTITKATDAYNAGAQLLFIHRDTDQHSRRFILEKHIEPILAGLEQKIKAEMQFVPLIIKHEQETWMLADLETLDRILGGKLDRNALNLPPNIEDRANTKELFKQAINTANNDQTRGRGYKLEAVVERLANDIDLGRLDVLKSYRQFVSATEDALRDIDYIQ